MGIPAFAYSFQVCAIAPSPVNAIKHYHNSHRTRVCSSRLQSIMAVKSQQQELEGAGCIVSKVKKQKDHAPFSFSTAKVHDPSLGNGAAHH